MIVGDLISGAGRGVIEPIINGIGSTLDNLFTSDDERAKARLALEQVAQLPVLKEIDRQIAEAQHPSVFVAGARPAMTWAAAVGVFYAFVGQPILTWAIAIWAWKEGVVPPPMPPSLDVYELTALVLGGAGLYRMRGMEKEKGVARDNLSPIPPRREWRP